MLHPQIIVHERDGRLAQQLRPLAESERWPLREPRQADVLDRLLRQGGPAVLVVKLGPTPERELALLERVSWQWPDVATVAVGDVDDADTLAGLAWDVGADYALFTPLSRDLLPEVVAGLMRRAVRDTLPAAAAEPSP
jgi:DNA-binding response OmpR family regulator